MLRKFLLASFAVATATIYVSCSKDADNSVSDAVDTGLPGGETSYVVPTRKAKQITVTDPETGQVSIYFDCRDAGATCDVGETPKPPGGVGRMTEFAGGRSTFAANVAGKSHAEIMNYLDANRESSKTLFPMVFQPEIRRNIENGAYQLMAANSYVAIVENNQMRAPVFVYTVDQPGDLYYVAPDTAKTKVAKINTETGVVECKEAGKNCAVRLMNRSFASGSDYYAMIEAELNNKELPLLIQNGSYKIYETKQGIEIRPVSGRGETYYILK